MLKNTTEKVQKMTSRGQITLPASWRKKIKTEQILLKTKGDFIEISPFHLPNKNTQNEYTVFDAIRDNKGKGIKADDLLKILKEING
ncbi:MAG: hypothetical protein V1851_00205 [Patescibacteria group bacterium]